MEGEREGSEPDAPVPRERLEGRALGAAARAPSSGNLQPSRVFVVAGEPLAELKTTRASAGDPADEREFSMYPGEHVPPVSRSLLGGGFAAVCSPRDRAR